MPRFYRVPLPLALVGLMALSSCDDSSEPQPSVDAGLRADAAQDVGPSSDAGEGQDAARDLGAQRDGAPDLGADQGPADAGAAAADLGAADGRRLVLVIVDGARFSETLGSEDRALVPRMAELAELGCAPGPIRNEGRTQTSFGVGTLVTGTRDAWSRTAAAPNGQFTSPTVWEYYRKQTGADEGEACYVLPYLPEEQLWRPSSHPDYGEAYWPRIRSRARGDDAVTDDFITLIWRDSPPLVVLYLADVDGAGHSGDLDAYHAAIRRADANVGRVWDELQLHPDYRDRTLLLVSSDHGRHDDEHGGFTSHGDGCEGCRQVTFIAAGPGVDADCQPERAWTIEDLTPTAGHFLGFSTEHSTGEAMLRIFRSE